MPIKGQSKTTKRDYASSSTRTILVGERTWTDVEPGQYSLSNYPVSKKMIHLRHGSLPCDNDGAIELWRIKDHLQKDFLYCHRWSDEKWKACLVGGGGNKTRFQYRSVSSGTILYLRALQGHSGRNLIDPSLQNNGVIQSNFFQHIYHVRMCNQFTFHHQFRIDTRRTKFEQQTDSVLFAVDPMDKDHKDPDTIDLGTPRLAQYMHKA